MVIFYHFLFFKCRKYKNSEKVRKQATECFYKFQYMFDIPTGETFWSIFEKEREKYLAENMEELKKERLFANKLQLEAGTSTSSTIKKQLSTNGIERTRSTSLSSSTSSFSALNTLSINTSNMLLLNTLANAASIESPLSSTVSSSSINNSPLSASSNHSTMN